MRNKYFDTFQQIVNYIINELDENIIYISHNQITTEIRNQITLEKEIKTYITIYDEAKEKWYVW